MYIRRKVFSLMENESGEARYFSTTDYVYEDVEDRYFAKAEDEKKSGKKAGKIAAISGGSAVAAAAGAYGAGKGLNKIMQGKYDKLAGDAEAIEKLDKSVLGKANKAAGKYVDFVEGVPGKAKAEAEKVWDATKGAWVKTSDFAKENGGKIKDGTMNAAGKVWDATKGAWVKTSDFAKRAAGKAADFAKEKGGKVVEKSKGAAGKVAETASKVWATKGGKAAVLGTAVAGTAAGAYGVAKAVKNKKEKGNN